MIKNRKALNPTIKIKKTTKHYIRNFLSILLSFLLSMLFVTLSLLLVLQQYCFQKNTIIQALSSSNYYKNSYNELVNRVTAESLPTGLPSEVLQTLFQKNELEKDTLEYIDAMYQGEEYGQVEEERRVEWGACIDTFLETKNNIEVNRNQRKEYIELLLKEYRKVVKLPLLDYFIKIRKEYQIIHFFGVLFCASMIMLIIIILVKLNGWLHRFLRYFAYSTLAASLMLGGVPVVLWITKSYNRLHLIPEFYNDFIACYIIDIAGTILKTSAGYAALSMVIILTGKGMKANLIKFYKLSKG